jgi:hypothetical protein
VTTDGYISVRDWRRKPPLRLRVTEKPRTCWWWIKCTRCPHMAAVAIAPSRVSGCEMWAGLRIVGGSEDGENPAQNYPDSEAGCRGGRRVRRYRGADRGDAQFVML